MRTQPGGAPWIAGGSHTLWSSPTEGVIVHPAEEHSAPQHIPGADEHSIPELEADQDVPPRPEEEIADVLRSEPDTADHRQRDR